MMTDWGITQGARLKELRLKKGFTVPYVAKKINCGEASIYRWELGQVCPRHKFLRDMAFLYNVTLEELTGDDVSSKSDTGVVVTTPVVGTKPLIKFTEEGIEASKVFAPETDALLEMMATLTGKTTDEMLDVAVQEYAQYVFDWNKALEGFCNEG